MYHAKRVQSRSRFSRPKPAGRGSSSSSYSPKRSSYGARNRHEPKQLDYRYFVKRANPDAKAQEYTSQNSFSDFNLSEDLMKNILHHGYKTPTPIQDEAIPVLLSGRDVVGIAATGTGKTAAFLIPLINKLLTNHSERVLIVAPTRELAAQIQEELMKFSYGLKLYSVLCIGGVGIQPQIYSLAKRPHFVIGTPGRLRDLENQGKLNFNHFTNIVLDEVDRMLDMGFVREVKYIVSKLPQTRQSLFFSATMPQEAQTIMKEFLKDPVMIRVATISASENVDQDVIKVMGPEKIDVLHDLLVKPEFEKVLVFGRTKWGMEKLARVLSQKGHRVAAIHGNKKQSQRQRAIQDFKTNRIQVLLATDIASRGLDINNVTHVINFDPPESYEDYIHRIGRTGRAGKKGIALTFVE